ncbi:P-II family nitrogen regulator [Methanospirillum stamsii]|uniref:P-II family nitrogen regulator n=1 Tax=Methanospirillum stamsii TaxID=1277351 RepID=A0A2V2MZ75_9EURY|nr:P-II family nitrogen regulator [Methanospirillum stamsii]PWR70716.1 P-II family nitrogen regulator [Methanospirillum stamsii]
MKKIEAFVRVEKITDVRNAMKAMGHGSMINYDIWYRGTSKEVNQYNVQSLYDFMPKIKVEMVVDDEIVNEIIDIICESAFTGNIGDGKIFIIPVEEAIRIQTRENGDMIL